MTSRINRSKQASIDHIMMNSIRSAKHGDKLAILMQGRIITLTVEIDSDPGFKPHACWIDEAKDLS